MERICRVIKTSDGTGYFLTIRCVLFRISDTENGLIMTNGRADYST